MTSVPAEHDDPSDTAAPGDDAGAIDRTDGPERSLDPRPSPEHVRPGREHRPDGEDRGPTVPQAGARPHRASRSATDALATLELQLTRAERALRTFTAAVGPYTDDPPAADGDRPGADPHPTLPRFGASRAPTPGGGAGDADAPR